MRLLFVVVLITAVCACGNGGAVTVAPSSAGGSTFHLTNEASAVAIPVSGGIAGTMTFPPLSVAATVQLTASTSAPAGVQLEQAQRHPQNLGTLAAFYYVTIMPETTVTLPSLPSFTLTFPTLIPTAGKSFFDAISAPHATGIPSHLDTYGPAAVSGQAVSFAAVDSPLTLAAGQAYTFIIYATYDAPAGPSTPRVYVALCRQTGNQCALAIFNPDGSSGTPAQITTSEAAHAVAVDAAGKIYLTDSSTLTTYNSDGSPALPTIAGLHDASGVAVDASGKIYVVSRCEQSPDVSQCSPLTSYDRNGKPTPPTIKNAANAIALDRNGKIYVLNAQCAFDCPSRILTYMPDGTPTTPTIDLPETPADIAVDGAGKIYVAYQYSDGNGKMLTTYSPAGLPTTPTITGTFNPSAVAVDANGKIYLSSFADSFVRTYSPDGAPTVPTITDGLFYAYGIAVH